MNKFTLAAVASAALSMCMVAQAQSLPEPVLAAVRAAVTSNPEVQAKFHVYEGADAEQDVAQAGFLPQVDLTAGLGRTRASGVTSGTYGHSNIQLALNQMLFDGNLTRSEVARLGHAKLARYYELLAATEDAALEALRVYTEVQRQYELVELARLNYAEHRTLAQQVAQRVQGGLSRGSDQDQANGRLALAESNLLTEISALHDASARYLRIIGQVPNTPVAGVAEGTRLSGLPRNALEALKTGLPRSYTVNAAYENTQSALSELEGRKAAYMPRVDARLRGGSDRNPGVLQQGTYNNTTVEVVMNYNLYRGGADEARELRAKALYKQAQQLQEKACRDVRQNLSVSFNDIVRLTEQLGYLDQHRMSTEKALAAYREQFLLGQRTSLDLLDAQNEYFEASRAYTNARFNEFVAQAATLNGMGKLTVALGVLRTEQPNPSDAGVSREQLSAEAVCPFETPPVLVVNKTQPLAGIPTRLRVLPVAALSK